MIIQDVPMHCINQAAIAFHVPAVMIVAVMKTEGGWNGAAIKNKNGSEDLGVMQINSRWLPVLKKQGITKYDVQFNPCINVQVGAWLLAKSSSQASGWQGIGNYHSRTLRHNVHYREKVRRIYHRIQAVLKESNT